LLSIPEIQRGKSVRAILVSQVHCQGGKGRTGTFCAALLLWTGFCTDADDALEVYARRRTDPRLGRRRRLQGVDSPSQRRYVRYLERALYSSGDRDAPVPPPARRTLLTTVVLESPPIRRGKNSSARLSFIVEALGTVQYDHAKRHGAVLLPSKTGGNQDDSEQDSRNVGRLRFELGDGLLVSGDVTVRFFLFEGEVPVPPAGAELGPGARTVRYGGAVGRQLCFLSLHTAFHNDGDVGFPRAEIDGAYNQSEAAFPAEFAVILTFESRSETVAGPTRSPKARSARKTTTKSSILASLEEDNSGSVRSSPCQGSVASAKLGTSRGGESTLITYYQNPSYQII
jgi:hypothetical protein